MAKKKEESTTHPNRNVDKKRDRAFNQTNQKVNTARSAAVNDFNETERRFADEHMPHYR